MVRSSLTGAMLGALGGVVYLAGWGVLLLVMSGVLESRSAWETADLDGLASLLLIWLPLSSGLGAVAGAVTGAVAHRQRGQMRGRVTSASRRSLSLVSAALNSNVTSGLAQRNPSDAIQVTSARSSVWATCRLFVQRPFVTGVMGASRIHGDCASRRTHT